MRVLIFVLTLAVITLSATGCGRMPRYSKTWRSMSDVGKSAVRLRITKGDGRAICTGVFVSSTGLIATANHCVSGAKEIHVEYAGAFIRAWVVASAVNTDIAIIDIPGRLWPSMQICQSLKVGDGVCALGSPTGFMEFECGQATVVGETLTFTDTKIRKGFSGGPLVASGRNCLAGINFATVDFLSGRRSLHVGLGELRRLVDQFNR